MIEWRQRSLSLMIAASLLQQRLEFMQPDLVERSGKRGMALGLRPNDIDIFQTRGSVNPQVVQVFAKESEAFAAEKNRDQREHDDGDDCVAAEEISNALLDQSAMPTSPAGREIERRNWLGDFHPRTMRTGRGAGRASS